MRPANPFLLLVLLGPAVAMYWGWLPATVATVIALAIGYLARRQAARSELPRQPGAVLLLAQFIALIPMAAVAAIVLAATLRQFPGPIGAVFSTLNPWFVPLGAIVAAAIISFLPERIFVRPLARLAAILTLVVLVACAIGLPVAAIFGANLPTFDDTGAPAGVERIALELVAPMFVWKPAGVPPMLPTILVVITTGALIVIPWAHGRHIGTNASPGRATAFEASVAALALVACAAGISLGTNRPVQESGSTGTGMGDTSLVSGAYFWVNDIDGTHGFLSEFRSPDVRKTGWNGYLHPLATRRIAYYQSPEQGRVYSWGAPWPTDLYNQLDVYSIAAMEQRAGILTNDMRRGDIGMAYAKDGQWVDIKSTMITEVENDAIRQPFHLPGGTLRFDRAGRVVTLTGGFTYAKQYQRPREGVVVPSVTEAVIHGGANLLRALRIPRAATLGITSSLAALLAFLLLEFSLRAQRATIRAIACVFVPRTTGPACAACGYDMRGVPATASRCPECGEEDDFVPEGERRALPFRASPFNPARWIAWPPLAMIIAVLLLPFVTLIPSWGWGQAWSRWHNRIMEADAPLWPVMIAAANVALGIALIARAPGSRSLLKATLGWAVLLISATAIVWLGYLVWERPNLYLTRLVGVGIAPMVFVTLILLITLIAIIANLIHIGSRNPPSRSPNNPPTPPL